MTRKRHAGRQRLGEIDPAGIYRTTLSEEIFSLGPQAVTDKEKTGELPPSFPLSASSRFRAWTGQQILDHRASMKELAEKELAAAKDRPPMPQPKQLEAGQKTKKLKLRPPARQRESA